jgi:hypothetical protein
MNAFVQKHSAVVTGVLSGFDRLVFRGTLRGLHGIPVMEQYLRTVGVLLKDFGKHVQRATGWIKQATIAQAAAAGRPLLYLPSAQTSKEDTAREIARRDGVTSGLLGVLSCVEVCRSFDIYRNRAAQRLQLVHRTRKCLHYYHYWEHPEYGFMHARLQTWFPFTIQVCLNGRDWLARQMDRAGLAYQQQDNCFPWIEDVERAQALLDEQRRTDWSKMLNGFAAALNPAHGAIFPNFHADYYWTAHQTEWATDVMFRSPQALAGLYPSLVRHGLATFGSPDVMRFLGRRVPAHGAVPGPFAGEVVTDLKTRPEGVRVKHRVNGNWLKMYDKQGRVLRVETVINDPTDFRAYRPKEGGPKDDLQWRVLRRGVADLHRRAAVSDAANQRYLDALADVDADLPLGQQLDRLSRPTSLNGCRCRGLNLWGDDAHLLATITRGEFVLNGFRNRDLRTHLYGPPASDRNEEKRRSARVSRLLRLLRAHHLIKKVPCSHRYELTDNGRLLLLALSAARNASPRKLTELAA